MILPPSIRNKLGLNLTQLLLPAWFWNNRIVITWILNSVSKAISSSLLFSDFARARLAFS